MPGTPPQPRHPLAADTLPPGAADGPRLAPEGEAGAGNPLIFLDQLVTRARQRIRLHTLIRGAAAVEVLAVGWLIAAVALDMLTPLAVPLRLSAWAGFWAVLLASGVLAVAVPMLRRLDRAMVALRIEKAMGGMHNRLLTALDLKSRYDTGQFEGVNMVLAERVVDQAAGKLAGFDPGQVAEPRAMLKALAWSSFALAGFLLMVLVFFDRAPTALARIFRPTADIAPATGVAFALSVRGGGPDADALQGEPASVAATLTRGKADDLRIELIDAHGRRAVHPMDRQADGSFRFEVAEVTASFRYKVHGGGTWSAFHDVRMVTRPLLQDVAFAIRPPTYMGLPERAVEPGAAAITAPEGSTVLARAKVAGDPARGQLRLFERQAREVRQASEREQVWFDDELPPDAEPLGAWNWSTDRPYSGTRQHAFGWDRKPYGFKTKFSKLRTRPEESFFLYVWLDPTHPPADLIVSLADEAKQYRMVWGKPVAQSDTPEKRWVHLGPLPTPGQWVRLEAGLDKVLGQRSPDGAKFRAIFFEVDGGTARFDRCGSLEKQDLWVKTDRMEAGEALAMARDGSTGLWAGSLPVGKAGAESHFSLQFFNALGHPNLAMKPVAVRSVADAPPSVVVERPVEDVTLAHAEPVPYVVRAFDDFGIRSVRLQVSRTGREPGDFIGVGDLLAAYDQPAGERLLIGALDVPALGMRPGDSVHVRFVVLDLKGQAAASRSFRVALAKAEDKSAASQRPADLAGLEEQVAQAVRRQDDIARKAADLEAKASPTLNQAIQEAKGREDRADPAQPGDAKGKALDQLTPAERRELAELGEALGRQRDALERLGGQLGQAARQAEKSPLSTPIEALALDRLARESKDLADRTPAPAGDAGEPRKAQAGVRQLAQGADQAREAREQLERMRRELRGLQESRDTLKDHPAEFAKQVERQAAQNEARDAADQLKQLDEQLARSAGKLDDLQGKVGRNREEAGKAEPAQLDDVGKEQNKLDRQSNQAIDEAHRLAREVPKDPAPKTSAGSPEQSDPRADPRAGERPQADGGAKPADAGKAGEESTSEGGPKADDGARKPTGSGQDPRATGDPAQTPPGQAIQPWTPPGKEGQGEPKPDGSTPSEARQPGGAKPSEDAKGSTQQGQQPGAPGQKPGGKPSPAGDPSGKDLGEGKSGEDARGPLVEHQKATEGKIAEAGKEVGQARGTVKDLRQQLNQLADQAGGAAAPGSPGGDTAKPGQPPPTQPGPPGSPKDAASPQPGARPGQPAPPSQQAAAPGAQRDRAAQELRQLLADPRTQQALRAAERGQRLASNPPQPGADATPPQPGEGAQPGSRSPREGVNLRPPEPGQDQAGRALDPGDKAALYKLPPALRQPLLQGMKEKGPQGYQDLIDAYYKQLSKDVGED